jgi:hypothetical protein
MADITPVPTYFGWRYILWVLWSNVITGLMVLQAAFAALLLIADSPSNAICSYPGHVPVGNECDPLIPHVISRSIILANAVLCGVIAQIKRGSPVPDRPIATVLPPSKSESP